MTPSDELKLDRLSSRLIGADPAFLGTAAIRAVRAVRAVRVGGPAAPGDGGAGALLDGGGSTISSGAC